MRLYAALRPGRYRLYAEALQWSSDEVLVRAGPEPARLVWDLTPKEYAEGDVVLPPGVDPKGLKATVEKFNGYAHAGKDPDFKRGDSLFDRYYGDANVTPNPCLAPLDKPPYYGMDAFAGDLGTKGGLKTDGNACVVTEAGEPIPGLYAIGNCSASVMGRSYAGAGATIGPAMTFGYIAARHAIPS